MPRGTLDPVESREIQSVVHDELARLPYRYRAPLVLCELERQTHEEAAAQLGCPVGTIKSRLSRGRERLRERLARRGLASPMLFREPMLTSRLAAEVPLKLLRETSRAAAGILSDGTVFAGQAAAQTAFFSSGAIRMMTGAGPKLVSMLVLAGTVAVGSVWFSAGGGTPIEESSHTRGESQGAPKAPAKLEDLPQPPEGVDPPRRGALRVATLKHAGDWDVAPRATPNLMRTVRQRPLSFDVVIESKDLQPRDPNLIYYPLLTVRGRAPFHFSKEDLEALRNHLEPGGGTIFGDAYLGSRDFDASFRKFVKEVLPNETLVPIPKDDELYTNKIAFDLANVEFTKAAGGGRGFPRLEGVKINGHWAIIYSKRDLSAALEGKSDDTCMGYTTDSARKIASNIVIYSTLP